MATKTDINKELVRREIARRKANVEPELAPQKKSIGTILSEVVQLGPARAAFLSESQKQKQIAAQKQFAGRAGTAGLQALQIIGKQLDRLPVGAPARALLRGQGMKAAGKAMLDPDIQPMFSQTFSEKAETKLGKVAAGVAGFGVDVIPTIAFGGLLRSLLKIPVISKALPISKVNKLNNTTRKLKLKAKEASNQIDDEVRAFSLKLDDAAVDTSRTIQEGLPKVFKGASEQYGKQLDDIIVDASKKGFDDIKAVNFKASIDDTINIVTEGGVIDSPMLNVLKKQSNEMAALIKSKGQTASIKVKDFINKDRQIRGKGIKTATRKSDPDDFVKANWNQQRGNLLEASDEKFAEAFSDLNKRYAISMQPANQLAKIYKPYSRGAFLQSGAGKNLIKANSLKTADKAERDLMKIVKTGDDNFIKGFGNEITSDVDDIADVVKIITQNDPRSAGILADDIRASIAVMEKELSKAGKLVQTKTLRQSGRNLESTMRRIKKIEARKRLMTKIVDRIVIVGAAGVAARTLGGRGNRGGN